MASVEECRAALGRLADALAANADNVRQRVNLDRTVLCRVTDLGTSFRGRLREGQLQDVAEGDGEAQITLSATSDDLIALADGELEFARAWAARRVSVRASPFDLVKLRKLL